MDHIEGGGIRFVWSTLLVVFPRLSSECVYGHGPTLVLHKQGFQPRDVAPHPRFLSFILFNEGPLIYKAKTKCLEDP